MGKKKTVKGGKQDRREAKQARRAAKKKAAALAALGLRGWLWRLGLAGVGGVLVFLSFPNFLLPFDAGFLAWFALVPILFAVRGTSLKQHLLLGLWSGAIINLGGFYWITGMLMDFGHMAGWMAAGLCVLLAVYQGLVYAVWMWIFYRLKRWSRLGHWLLAPVAYVPAEFAIWFIFPWYYANSQYKIIPFIQICELGGVTLLSFLLVMANAALYEALVAYRAGARRIALRRSVLVVLLPALLAGYGLMRMAMVDGDVAAAPKLQIGLVEADVGIWEKEDPDKIKDNLVRHQRMSRELQEAGAELIVWPETSYHAPYTIARTAKKDEWHRYRPIPRDATALQQSSSPPPERSDEDVVGDVPMADRVAVQRGFSVPLLFGGLTYRINPDNPSHRHPGVDYLNSAILIDGQGQVLGIYDKVYLLMFGEHIPLGETFPVFYQWLPEAGDLTPGHEVMVLPFRDYRIGIMVCYEDILPTFIRKVADQDPNVLINVTNDAWFGKTAEPYLHLALAVFRTVESRVSLIRSTNTGVSCFVDPLGRIRKQTGLEGAETLLDEVPMMDGGTPYQVLGDWPAWLSILALPVLWWRRRQS